ncbi:outer membrane protein assembly factor BamA [Candidatus Pelagibacter bacterium]|nr:outer membrane protein assembly factor BamA [Candidatus Pelagibacter bacterium]
MVKSITRLLSLNFLFVFLIILPAFSEIVEKIEIQGNERISDETIIMFSRIKIGENLNEEELNVSLKNLFETNFFKNVILKIENNILIINVIENPIVQNINLNGIKAKKIKDPIFDQLNLKERSSYNKILLRKDVEIITSTLKNLGYYFPIIDTYVEELPNNIVNINFDVTLNEKAKIKKISFIGNKVFKDGKLKRVIISEEYKFWKFISGKKFLNENLIQLDNRLLENFYKNNGYYNAKINSSFAKLINDDDFNLIFNIESNEKFYFDKLSLTLPNDFDQNHFKKLYNLFDDFSGKYYSLNKIEKILKQIEKITTEKQFESTKAEIEESFQDNKISLNFIIKETDKFYVEKINIFGNNVTQESVIRNQLEIDEGEPFNDLLNAKSINNIKNLNFFKVVKPEIIENKNNNTKVINIYVEEKPTGEIMAGAGVGTSGNTISAAVKENNFLGRGIGLDTSITLSTDSVRGLFSVDNPNFRNSDKSVYFNIESSETDKLTEYGYKTNKSGFSLGTKFEYYDDFFFGIGSSNFYEKIETDINASSKQKKQTGSYWDSFIKFNLDLDKRNQKFQTSDGYRSSYSLDTPILSDTNTLQNTYSYELYKELFDKNVSTFSLYLKNSNSISGEDVKLSERLFIPSKKLRGFEYGKTGPKDAEDYIGGNYVATINFTSTLPYILENSQNTDFLFFLDAANVWGVDYDSSINDSNTIRSSFGLGLDWFTPIGPLNMSVSQVLSKDINDITETFRFNLGTTF